jgi:hypothetical protein
MQVIPAAVRVVLVLLCNVIHTASEAAVEAVLVQ